MRNILLIVTAIFSINAFAVQTKKCPEKIEVTAEGLEVYWGLIKKYREQDDKDIVDISAIANRANSQKDLTFSAVLTKAKYRQAGMCEYTMRSRRIEADIMGSGNGYLRLHIDLGIENGNLTVYANIKSLAADSIELENRKLYSMSAYFQGRGAAYYDGGPERRTIGGMKTVKVDVP